ncbi:N-acetyltransferase [Nocardioides sp. Y6]|uniref:N-acetyltransferase n=2 Tax=Nocardioides malaquae TaxID=2773426 RepID=A0ABR9RTN9_9ACTN|nr:N-acetyltransferase [Nocardioides malaquae]
MNDRTAISSDSPTVRDNPEQNRFEVLVGETLAGFADYRRSEGRIDFTHTEVFEQFGGRGLAKTLAAASLDEARAQGLAVRPYCPLYARFIAKNSDYLDLVAEGDRAEFDLA